VIFSKANIFSDHRRAIEHVLAVDAVVDLSHPVVAGVGVGKTAVVSGRSRGGSLDHAARAGEVAGWRRRAAKQLQADGIWRHASGLQRFDRIHHAVRRIAPQWPGCGNGSAKCVADQAS
jgi:hypothetical protein